MTGTAPLDLDAMFAEPTPPVVIQQQTPRSPVFGNYLLIAVVCLFAGMYLSKFEGCNSILPIPDGQDEISVRVEGPTVLIAWDNDGTASEGQSDVLTTTKVQTWCEENGYRYRKFDIHDDLSRAEPYWKAMMSSAASPPSLTIAKSNGSAVTLPLPSTVQETIDRINKEGK